jgi:hypothetical protein
MRYLEVAVLPIYDKPSDTWSLLRFYTDLGDQVWMTVDDTGHAEKVAGYPDDAQIREAMLPYLRSVAKTGDDVLGLVGLKLESPPWKYETEGFEGQEEVRWDFEVEDRPGGIYVTRMRRGPQSPWVDPTQAHESVRQYMVLESHPDKKYAGGKMLDVDWKDVHQLVTSTDMPRSEDEHILASFTNQPPTASALWFPDIYPGRRRAAIWVDMKRAKGLRRYKSPRAEARRLIKEFG